MKITGLNQAIKDKERVNVFIDGEFTVALDKNTITQELLFVGKEIDSDYLIKLKDIDSYNLISRKILSWALSRPRSFGEVKEKINKIISNRKSTSFNANLNKEDLYKYIADKLDKNSINDTTFAAWWIQNRVAQGKYGKARINSELIAKGVNSAIVKRLLNEYYPEDTATVENLLVKKFGVTSIKDIKDAKIRARAYRYIVSKGFRVL